MFPSTNSCFVKDISLHEDGGQQTGKRKTITINKILALGVTHCGWDNQKLKKVPLFTGIIASLITIIKTVNFSENLLFLFNLYSLRWQRWL